MRLKPTFEEIARFNINFRLDFFPKQMNSIFSFSSTKPYLIKRLYYHSASNESYTKKYSPRSSSFPLHDVPMINSGLIFQNVDYSYTMNFEEQC